MTEMRKFLIPIFIIVIAIASFSFTYKVDKVQWYSWEQAMELAQADHKKIIVFIHTDNCVWCAKMENATFNETHISSYINEMYLPVKFNAQDKETILFNNKEYKYIKQGNAGYHELAAALTGGRLVYPTTVFLDEEIRVLQSIQGYQEYNFFEMILTFYGEDNHTKTPWKKYKDNYEPITKIQTKFVPDDDR
ncbi:MAG: thioredoxin-related protein [Saprospiraceae bacterium]|jgi:thioredoxin-related protein